MITQFLKALFLFGCLTMHLYANEPKLIYIAPGYWGDLCDINNPNVNQDNRLEPLYRLCKTINQEGFKIRQTNFLEPLDDFKYLIVFEIFPDQLEMIKKYPKEKLVLFLWEPPSVLPQNYETQYHHYFSKIYTWDDTLVDNKTYFKFYYPVLHPMIEHSPNFDTKKLCTLICCNKNSSHPNELYTQRRQLIYFYETHHPSDFSLYGRAWPSLNVYKGTVPLKVNTLQEYRFAYAYENIQGVPGYITEKIFDCFHAGCVPIYWGAPNISQYIPSNCYIARTDFESDEQLYLFLKNMPQERYQQYIDNIRRYLQSDQAHLYSADHFVSIVMELIRSRKPCS